MQWHLFFGDVVKSNREWRFWGETDPLFAVNSRADKRAGLPGAWTADEFLATGETYFADVAAQWRQYGMGEHRCIEVGCGAGRITGPLLARFASVVAIDVSHAQIESAKRLLGERAKRVSFFVVDEPVIPVDDDSCDGFFSSEVFQHFSNAAGIRQYLSAAVAKLMPGATACFQLPISGLQRLTRPIDRLRVRLIPVQRMLGRKAIMDFRFYEAPAVFLMMEAAGFRDCEMRVFEVDGHGGRPIFFFGRKPSSPSDGQR
ncbi:MAG: class I SAM-dependent methyltransferase [Gemmatimonadota bacterium]|nr:class I SAM-dependent methyltransferase [Gemmatimonadota bacterium]